MDKGGTYHFTPVRRFNGALFHDARALPLDGEAVQLLSDLAALDWSQIDPSIFGTLLERALSPRERHRLGAHYTPRAFVQRLVVRTIDEPLRRAWDAIQTHVQERVANAPNMSPAV